MLLVYKDRLVLLEVLKVLLVQWVLMELQDLQVDLLAQLDRQALQVIME